MNCEKNMLVCFARDDDVDNNDGDEDFSYGINTFISTVHCRRLCRLQQKSTGGLSAQDIGIENRLIAAATFEKTFVCVGLFVS